MLPFVATTEAAVLNAVFTLYPDQGIAMKQTESISTRYVLYFSESLRGLSVGAPLTLLGLPAGEVTDVGFAVDPATMNIRGRVEITSYPERLVARLNSKQIAFGKSVEPRLYKGGARSCSDWSSNEGCARSCAAATS